MKPMKTYPSLLGFLALSWMLVIPGQAQANQFDVRYENSHPSFFNNDAPKVVITVPP